MSYNAKEQYNSASIQRIANFTPLGTGVAISATTSTGNVALPTIADGSPATDILVMNTGAVPVFVAFGTDNTLAAVIPTGTAANGIAIPAGKDRIIRSGISPTYAAAITASSTASVYFYQGFGS